MAQVKSRWRVMIVKDDHWVEEWPADVRHALKTLHEAEWKLRRELRGKANATQ